MGRKAPDLSDIQQERFRGILIALAERVRKLRKAKGLSGRAFAEQVGIAHATLVGIEAGAINMSLIIVFLVAEALEVEVGVLLDGLVGPKVTLTTDERQNDEIMGVTEPSIEGNGSGKTERERQDASEMTLLAFRHLTKSNRTP